MKRVSDFAAPFLDPDDDDESEIVILDQFGRPIESSDATALDLEEAKYKAERDSQFCRATMYALRIDYLLRGKPWP